MFNLNLTSKPMKYVPIFASRRWKVHNLPKEKYEDYESPYMKHEKPKVKTYITNFYSIVHRKNLTWAHFKNWRKWKFIEQLRKDQKYMPERHQTLGPDLATTHFFTIRGGKVKFYGNDNWITKDDVKQKRVPSLYTPGYYVEEVDASDLELCYEGFDNLCNLIKLKKLHLRNCRYIDDWSLSRSHLFANTLEFLDISGCHFVTERGICTLHTLKKLQTLVINDTPNIHNKELVCLLLQDVIPDCEIIGVNYNNPILLKRIQNYMH